MLFPVAFKLVSAVLLLSSVGGSLAAIDPCAAIAGKAFIPPADARACLKSFPFNETLRQNVLTNIARVFDFFTFEEYYLRSPPPFQESTLNIRETLARINRTKYATDYDFNIDLFDFTTQLNDGHTRWFPNCYRTFQNIAPAPVSNIVVNASQGVYIAHDLVNFISLLGPEYTGYFDSIGFNWKRLAGARVLSIEGQDPYVYVDRIARTVSGNYLDHGVRVNSVFTSYRISGSTFSQRLGDLAGPIGVKQDTIAFSLIPVGKKTPEVVRVPFLASFTGSSFGDSASYWINNCVAKEFTNGVDLKLAGSRRQGRRQPVGSIMENAGRNATAIDLPSEFIPTLPPTAGSGGVIKSYILPGNETGVIFVGSFGGDFFGFQSDVVSAISDFKAAGVVKVLIDLTGNGGGFVCLGQFLFKYLAGSRTIDYPGFVSTARGNTLAQRVVSANIELGLDATLTFYAPDNWGFLNGTQMPPTYNYMNPTLPFFVNGILDPTSQRFQDTCELAFEEEIPEDPPFPLDNIAIVNNGNCASTCAMFSTLMYEHFRTKIAVFGGKPNETIEFKGMAGNQVLEWADLDTEIKTANLKGHPLAPPDLLVDGNFRHNWRTAWSFLNKNVPIAYKSELPTRRFAYTQDTYINPLALWTFAAGELFRGTA